MLILLRSKWLARTFGRSRLRIALGVAMLGVVGFGSSVSASPSPIPPASFGTPLPPGWELCVLQGVGAPGTPDNVANLDEWQVVEGGSTNNTAAYNPFNTRQVTDSKGSPLPVVATSDGFPAFATWVAGCASTVAALLQPIMAPIVTALQAGSISVPGIFLADVDQSPWCAPSGDGIPCYASEILAGELVEALLNGSSGQLQGALTSYSDTGADLRAYEEDASATAIDQVLLKTRNEQLVMAEHEVSVAQGTLSRATRAFRRLAIEDYTGDRLLRSDPTFHLFAPADDQDIVTQYFRNIAASLMNVRYDQAEAAVKTSVAKRQAADASVVQATSLLDSATGAESQALSGLEVNAKTIEAGLACTPPPLITAAASPVGSQSSVGQLWTALQDCLTPPVQPGTPITASAPS